MANKKLSSYMFFRLIFTAFFLFLMGDAFYRWDGFRYYASFPEFLSSLALTSILWSGIALIAAISIWLPLKTCEWASQRVGLKIKIDHMFFFVGSFVFFGVLVWAIKQYVWTYKSTSLLKFIIFIFNILVSVSLTWLFRSKLDRLAKWTGVIQERITPLVWLFGMFVLFSVPLVAYYTWFKGSDKVISQEMIESRVSDEDRPNILLVTFDALTARDMSEYGYDRLTTPFISKWADNATVFMHAKAADNYTFPTTLSLMTGKRVWTHQQYSPHGRAISGNVENLAQVLKNKGYFTMAYIQNDIASVNNLGIANSVDIAPSTSALTIQDSSLYGIINVFLYQLFADKIRLYNWILKEDFIFYKVLFVISPKISTTTVSPEITFNKFLETLDNNPPEPYFAWVHILPPHDPYLPPQPFIGMYNASSELRTNKNQSEGFVSLRQYSDENKPFPPEMLQIANTFRDRYDEFIQYCDKQFEDFIGKLQNRGLLDNTVIILSADHGESFEHNYVTHGGPHLYEQLTHIPLIIKEPGQSTGKNIGNLVEQIDIATTILDLVDISAPTWMEGRSLKPLLHDKKLSSHAAFSMSLYDNPRNKKISKGTIAVWEGNYKLIHYLEENKSLLFNLKKDQDELFNLYDSEREIGQRMLSIIKDNLKKANERIIER